MVIGILRLDSGSVWPAVLLHGSWNALVQGPFDHVSSGPDKQLWVGESGVLVALVCVALAIAIARRPWCVNRWPGDPLAGPLNVLRLQE